ncbi:MAG TPA: transaldolase family protein [Planctomycetota bacterium]
MTEAPAVAASELAKVIREDLVEETLEGSPNPVWKRLRELGTDLWLDTGDMDQAAANWSAEFTALTTNNSLLNKEIQKGLYDRWIPRAAAAARKDMPGVDDRELVLEIAFALNARHGLRLVERFGAYVSVELHTDLAHDVERSVAYGRRYHALCPDRFIVKVPLTPSGLLAARQLEDLGIPVNFTLGFSARQNYLITCVARPSWVNVFLGRLNAYVAEEGLGNGDLVGERTTLASQKVVRELRGRLGISTRQIAASLRSGAQCAALAGLDVYTMPIGVARGFLDLKPVPAEIGNRSAEDYRPVWADGVDPVAEGLEGLWDVPEQFRKACLELTEVDAKTTKPQMLVEALHEAGQGSVFPRWSAQDVAAVQEDGKMPKRARWAPAIKKGSHGLDALFTAAGLLAFAQDQAALDDRIRHCLS